MIMFKSSLVSSFLLLLISGEEQVRADFFSYLRGRWFSPYQDVDCNSVCPSISPVTDFDLDKFIEKSWYIQKQQVTPYQDESQLYCVTATYETSTSIDGFIEVKNYGNNNEVNGAIQSSDDLEESSFGRLCAEQVSGAELRVAPCCLSASFATSAGPYWVIALDTENYEWAIINGGQPDRIYESDGTTYCTNGNDCINGSGLWLFSRTPEATDAVIATMEQTLLDMGIWTGELKTVTQSGCNYDGATLKT